MNYIPSKNALFSLVVFLLSTAVMTSQDQMDTLNKFNINKKKQGYWTVYFDSLFNFCESNKAKYFSYMYYDNGKSRARPIPRMGKRDIISYKPFLYSDSINLPILLNGEIIHYELQDTIKKPRIYDAFINGKLYKSIEYINWKREIYPELETFYYDSLYNNNPSTFLLYKKERNVTVYKQYFSFNKPILQSERTYLVKHKDFKNIYRPIIGLHTFRDTSDSKSRNFIELGFSKKYTSGTYVDTIDMTYKKHRYSFHSLNFSLMASNTYKQFCLGQKITYSYNLVLIRAEAGIVNYTDFKSTDFGFIFGVGFTVFGYLNEMIYVSIPIISNKRQEYPRISASIYIN